MGDLGLTFLAAAISCSWFTSSVIDNLSSGLTFKVEPKKRRQCNKPFRAFLSADNHFLNTLQCNEQTHEQSGETAKSIYKYNSHNSIHEKKTTLPKVNNISKNTP